MIIMRAGGIVAGAMVMVGVCTAAPASAISDIKGFGVQETLKNFTDLSNFNSEIGYTVSTLVPSRDVVPYPVAGRLWEATVTAQSLRGTVTPAVPDFNARTESGIDYRELANVSAPQGLNGGPLPEGATTTGKLYFDVVGENPNSVVYNDGSEDLLGWVNPPSQAASEVADQPPATGGDSSIAGGSGGGGGGGGDGSATGGGNKATPPSVSDGAQNGPYGPAGSTPPVGNNNG